MSVSRTAEQFTHTEAPLVARLCSVTAMRASRVHDASVVLPRGSERVVLAEDDERLRRVTRRLLENLGYDVEDFADGSAALEWLQSERPSYALLFTDYDMPGMNGYELARRMRTASPELRVILSSAWPEERLMPEGSPSDWPFYLAKPYTPAQLAMAVREVLDGPDVL